jgi:hypothetical protein
MLKKNLDLLPELGTADVYCGDTHIRICTVSDNQRGILGLMLIDTHVLDIV